jgi:hypothetical protein
MDGGVSIVIPTVGRPSLPDDRGTLERLRQLVVEP